MATASWMTRTKRNQWRKFICHVKLHWHALHRITVDYVAGPGSRKGVRAVQISSQKWICCECWLWESGAWWWCIVKCWHVVMVRCEILVCDASELCNIVVDCGLWHRLWWKWIVILWFVALVSCEMLVWSDSELRQFGCGECFFWHCDIVVSGWLWILKNCFWWKWVVRL